MLGAIIGDIVGSPYKFEPFQGSRTDFQLFNEKSEFTETTIFTCAIAEAIMLSSGSYFTDEEYSEVKKLCSKYKDWEKCKRRGLRVIYSVSKFIDDAKITEFRENIFSLLCYYGKKYKRAENGKISPGCLQTVNANPICPAYGSAAMFSPVGWACDYLDDIVDCSIIIGELFNIKPARIMESCAMAVSISMARNGAKKKQHL